MENLRKSPRNLPFWLRHQADFPPEGPMGSDGAALCMAFAVAKLGGRPGGVVRCVVSRIFQILRWCYPLAI